MRTRTITVSLSVPSTESTTTVGEAVYGLDLYDALLVTAALEGLTGGTLDVYLQDSWDGGTTWVDCAHFAQLSAGAAASVAAGSVMLDSALAVVGTGTATAATPALAANKLRAGPWGPLVRMVAVSGAGTSGDPVDQTVRLYAWMTEK